MSTRKKDPWKTKMPQMLPFEYPKRKENCGKCKKTIDVHGPVYIPNATYYCDRCAVDFI